MFKAFHADAALAPQPMSRPAPQAANAAQVSQQPQSRPVAAISEAEKPAASEMSAVQMLRRKAASTPKMAVSDGPNLDATSRPDTAFTSFKPAPAATPQKRAPAPVDPTLHLKTVLHEKLLEELNLAVLDKVSRDDLKREIGGLAARHLQESDIQMPAQAFQTLIEELLNEVLGLGPQARDAGKLTLLLLKVRGERFVLLVDELLGQQQVVVKNLESNYRKVDDVSGATIMGDGRVALILDVGALVRRSRH